MDVDQIKRLKGKRPITMLTAYDYQTARIMDEAGIDIILVGDSLGMVVLGYESTKQVTMNDMIRHTEAVAKGASQTFIVTDMPINTYDTSTQAIANARKLLAAGADAVKTEGNLPEITEALVNNGIQVMGHLGLLPQTAEELKVTGKKRSEGELILSEAKQLEDQGVFSVVLECIPENLAKKVTEQIGVPTIGIGAGINCDGQVLVVNDMLGMDTSFKPKHVKQYTNLHDIVSQAVGHYIKDVISKKFPDKEHSFH